MELTWEEIVGQNLLAGIIRCTPDHQIVEQRQYYGTIFDAGEEGIVVVTALGERLVFPGDLSTMTVAEPGEYTLSTGEVVLSPDLLATWVIIEK